MFSDYGMKALLRFTRFLKYIGSLSLPAFLTFFSPNCIAASDFKNLDIIYLGI